MPLLSAEQLQTVQEEIAEYHNRSDRGLDYFKALFNTDRYRAQNISENIVVRSDLSIESIKKHKAQNQTEGQNFLRVLVNALSSGFFCILSPFKTRIVLYGSPEEVEDFAVEKLKGAIAMLNQTEFYNTTLDLNYLCQFLTQEITRYPIDIIAEHMIEPLQKIGYQIVPNFLYPRFEVNFNENGIIDINIFIPVPSLRAIELSKFKVTEFKSDNTRFNKIQIVLQIYPDKDKDPAFKVKKMFFPAVSFYYLRAKDNKNKVALAPYLLRDVYPRSSIMNHKFGIIHPDVIETRVRKKITNLYNSNVAPKALTEECENRHVRRQTPRCFLSRY